MKIKELIDLLSKEDPESIVVVDGYEGGYNNIKTLTKVKILLNTRKEGGEYWWEGDWDHVYSELNSFDEIAICIPR